MDEIWYQQNYIPDICIDRSLWIQEYPSLNLVHNHSGGNLPEGDVSPKPEQTSDGTLIQLLLTFGCISLTIEKEYFRLQLPPPQKCRFEQAGIPGVPSIGRYGRDTKSPVNRISLSTPTYIGVGIIPTSSGKKLYGRNWIVNYELLRESQQWCGSWTGKGMERRKM
jgi:hypothetical protein